MNNLPDKRIYSSQNREDLILESFFCNLSEGYYVDIGAYHPSIHSVTKRFYDKGWRGINVEPQKEQYELFISDRKNDININVAVSDKSGEMILRQYNNRGLSTIEESIKREYLDTSSAQTKDYKDQAVKVKTLSEIFEEHKVSTIQFLKIDVEGHEYNVLSSNNWERFRPQIICIEADHIGNEWDMILTEADYSIVFFDGLNRYYKDSKIDSVELRFDYVEHVVLKLKGGISFEDYQRIRHLEKANADYASLVQNYQDSLDALRAQSDTRVKTQRRPKKIKDRLNKIIKKV